MGKGFYSFPILKKEGQQMATNYYNRVRTLEYKPDRDAKSMVNLPYTGTAKTAADATNYAEQYKSTAQNVTKSPYSGVFGGLSGALQGLKSPSAPQQPAPAPTTPAYGQYTGKGNPYNEILYWKQMFEGANGNKDTQSYAANQAKNYYAMIQDPTERAYIQSLNGSALANYLATKKPQDAAAQRANTPVDPNDYRTKNATIEDLKNIYGFDFTRDAANRVAEAERQAKVDNINGNIKKVDNSVMLAADGLDRDYFQKYMQQAQGQVNDGLNAGIAADQDLRLAMARQANLGEVYANANLEKYNLNNDLTRAEVEALARGEQLHYDRLKDAFGMTMSMDENSRAEQTLLSGIALESRGQDIGLDQFNRSEQRASSEFNQEMDQRQYEFGKTTAQDLYKFQKDKKLEWAQLNQEDKQFYASLGWEEEKWNTMSATDQEQYELAWAEHHLAEEMFNKPYNSLTASEKMQVEEAAKDRVHDALMMEGQAAYEAGAAGNSSSDFLEE